MTLDLNLTPAKRIYLPKLRRRRACLCRQAGWAK